jgi:hypothetical protein
MILLAFTVSSPAKLAKPALPGSFDVAATVALTHDLSNTYPVRTPGSAGAIGAASWFLEQPQPHGLGLPTAT